MITRRFDWGLFFIVVTIIVVVLGLGELLYLVIDSERSECHNLGGHMVNVNGDSVCVDRDDRVIHL